MTHPQRGWIALLVALLCLAGAARRVVFALHDGAYGAQEVTASSAAARGTSPRLARPTFAERNPFRLSRRPADPPSVGTAVESGPPYRPALRLAAVIGGPPWKALLAGVPHHSGLAIVSPGDIVDSITVLRITRDTVRLRGPDTTWTLVLHRTPHE